MPMSRSALVLLAVTTLAGTRPAWAMTWTAYDTAQLDALCAQWLGDGGNRRAPALSVAVGVNGRLIFARGYGEARPGVPASERTVYHIGSLTKQFTAAAMLSLIDGGAETPRSHRPVAADSAVSDVLEGFASWESHLHAKVTVRGLLTMTSGVADLVERPPADVDPWGKVSATRLLDALRERAPQGASDTFSYSNSGYLLLAQMVEALSASAYTGPVTFADFVRNTIIIPAGLKDTAFIHDDRAYDPTRVAVPSWGATPPHKRRPAFVEPEWLKGAADMASSATDLFAWDKALMEGLVISRAGRLAMFSDAARVTRSRYYAMAWFVEHELNWDWFSHGGFVPGFTSVNVIVRNADNGSWISVSLLTNADDVKGLEQLSTEIAHAVRRRIPEMVAAQDDGRE